ncbi:hypothetical protein ACFQ6E_38395 [Streptomyces sp. NPDC056462]|uniref:hypothetical protein n=1 Tax=Streptomyces sp. NPDC056462 TaxID=3345826 RepID=UPI0036901869
MQQVAGLDLHEQLARDPGVADDAGPDHVAHEVVFPVKSKCSDLAATRQAATVATLKDLTVPSRCTSRKQATNAVSWDGRLYPIQPRFLKHQPRNSVLVDR